MNKSKLKERLEQESVPKFLYSLDVCFPNEAFVLN
jgi:hypothetical protein